MTRPSDEFRLDEEHRSWLKDCLRKANFRLDDSVFKKFSESVQYGIQFFINERETTDTTFRQKHDALRKLYRLADEGDSSVSRLRSEIESLPAPIMAELNRLADLVIPRLFGYFSRLKRNNTSNGIKSSREELESRKDKYLAENKDFRSWARNAEDDKLVRAVRSLASRGFVIVPGRSRGSGKRSRPRIEPLVMGQARGGSGFKHKGGRPSTQDLPVILISLLGGFWEEATGVFPEAGRSDATGFGDLVHHVFSWLDEPGVEHSLRDYWDEIKKP